MRHALAFGLTIKGMRKTVVSSVSCLPGENGPLCRVALRALLLKRLVQPQWTQEEQIAASSYAFSPNWIHTVTVSFWF